MAFTSGAAETPSILLDRLNTFMTGNGWTKLRGLVDNAVASPKAARYWRVMMYETITTSNTTWGLQLLNFRTTVGGANVATVAANFSIDSLVTGTASLLISGGSVRFGGTGPGAARARKIEYDFGSPVTIRQVQMRAGATLNETPRSFAIQWSNDREVWTTMFEAASITWTTGETKLFTFDNGYLHGGHPGASLPRRSGGFEDYQADTNWETSAFRDFSEEVFIWQGPGYDAARRVFIHARGHCNTPNSSHILEFNYSTAYDALIRGWGLQPGAASVSLDHIMGSGTINYWFYLNAHRLVIVTQTGAADYTSTYIGFMAAFAHPDYYPFPLLMSSMSNSRATAVSSTDNMHSSMVDPGFGCLVVKKWDNVDYVGGNRPQDVTDNRQILGTNPALPMLWPAHFGGSDNNIRWPLNKGCGTFTSLYNTQHLFEFLVATQQGDLPLLPCIVYDKTHGNLGALTGVFAVPSAGILSPQQVLTISGQAYRVFPNRSRRNSASWFAIKEE